MNATALSRIAADQVADPASLAGRLTLLGTQMLKLAGEVSRRDPGDDRPGPLGVEGPIDDALLGLLAEEIYRNRRRRARHMPSRLLGEPAWDILLDLYVAAGRGRRSRSPTPASPPTLRPRPRCAGFTTCRPKASSNASPTPPTRAGTTCGLPTPAWRG